MRLDQIKTKQDMIDYTMSFRTDTSASQAHQNAAIFVCMCVCYDENGWRGYEPTSLDISDNYLADCLDIISKLPKA